MAEPAPGHAAQDHSSNNTAMDPCSWVSRHPDIVAVQVDRVLFTPSVLCCLFCRGALLLMLCCCCFCLPGRLCSCSCCDVDRTDGDVPYTVVARPSAAVCTPPPTACVNRDAVLSRLSGPAPSTPAALIGETMGEVVGEAVNTLVARTSQLLAFVSASPALASLQFGEALCALRALCGENSRLETPDLRN